MRNFARLRDLTGAPVIFDATHAVQQPGQGDGGASGGQCQAAVDREREIHDRQLADYTAAVLLEFGRSVPGFWSSELWEDSSVTVQVSNPEPLDLMLFGPAADAFGAHVGVFVGDERVLHLCHEVGEPVVWSLTEFARRSRYRVVVGIKRWKGS
jgi:hypothetical protein